jgi:hypothetical protein
MDGATSERHFIALSSSFVRIRSLILHLSAVGRLCVVGVSAFT